MTDIDKILDSILQGLNEANNKYYELSGGDKYVGEWISERGVESFAAAHVAQKLKDGLEYDSVILEATHSEMIDGGYIKRKRGKPIINESRQRFDILGLNHDEANDIFVCSLICELKRKYLYQNWDKDFVRINKIAKEHRDVGMIGCFGAFISDYEGIQIFDQVESYLEYQKEISVSKGMNYMKENLDVDKILQGITYKARIYAVAVFG